MRKSLIMAALTVSLLLALAACSTGSGDSPSTTINVTLTEFSFTPNAFTVPAGAQINFTATNNGSGEHSFVIMKQGDEVKDHFTNADQANVYWEKDQIQPGQTVTDTFTAPSTPGTYQILCAVAGHFEAGMTAKLIVK